MSRTYRNLEGMNRCALKAPKTYNEIKSLSSLIVDDELKDYPLSKRNRLNSRLHNIPTSYDDVVISGYSETDYKYPYKYGYFPIESA